MVIFLTTVVNFGFRTFWADLTLLCVKMCRFSGRKFPGYSLSFPFGNVGNPTKETSHLGMILTSHKMMVGMDYRIGFPA